MWQWQLVLLLIQSCVLAENITQILTRNYPPTSFSGPFELREAYPALLYYGSDWSNHRQHILSPDNVTVNMNTDDTLWKSDDDDIPLYLIYYGPTGSFTASRRDIFETFLTNIFTSSYWQVVREYTLSGKRAGIPRFVKSIFVDCTLMSQKCSLFDLVYRQNPASRYNGWKRILRAALNDQGFRLRSKGIYTIVLDEQVDIGRLVRENRNDKTPDVDRLGDRACSIVQTGFIQNRYDRYVRITSSYVSIPNARPVWVDNSSPYRDYWKPASNCFINPNNVNTSPNGDPGADAAINFMLHEIVESVLSPPNVFYNRRDDSETQDNSNTPVRDRNNNPPTDKCAQMWPNLVSSPQGDYNIILGGKRYLVNPVWSLTRQQCAMSG